MIVSYDCVTDIVFHMTVTDMIVAYDCATDITVSCDYATDIVVSYMTVT